MRYIETGLPAKIFAFDIGTVNSQFKALIAHFAGIFGNCGKTRALRQRQIKQQAGSIFIIYVKLKAEAVIKEACVDTKVYLAGGFPFQIGIGQLIWLCARIVLVVITSLPQTS